jgi:hypothetical protein
MCSRVRRRGRRVRQRAEVVDDPVVVPNSDVARTCEQALTCAIAPTVPPVLPEARQVDRDAETPDLVVAVSAGGVTRIVGVDHVAEPDEDIRSPLPDRVHDREPLSAVTADVLPRDIAAEGESHRGSLVVGRGSSERAAHGTPVRDAAGAEAEPDAVPIRRAGTEPVECVGARVVVDGSDRDRLHRTVTTSRQRHIQRRRAIGSGPEHRGARRHVADDDPVRHRRNDRLGRGRRRGTGRHQERYDQKTETEPARQNDLDITPPLASDGSE